MYDKKKVYYDHPSRSLPSWVQEAAVERGYADATESLGLLITPEDINNAFIEVAHGNGSACVMAQAGRRLGASHVYFYRTKAWVDFGEGPILRFRTTREIFRDVIEPFDRYDREAVKPGIYHLKPVDPSQTIGRARAWDRDNRKRGTRGPSKKAYMGRVATAATQ